MIPFGVGKRACIGQELAQRQLYKTVLEVGAWRQRSAGGGTTGQKQIELIKWFNAEIKGHFLNVGWTTQ